MKVILLNTMSINGIIGLEDGNEDFLSDEGGDYVTRQAKEYGCIIWGRRAYDNVQNRLTEFNDKLAGVYRVIVSKDPNLQLADGYTLANGPEQALELIQKRGLDTALLDGGGKLNTSFLAAGLVDEIHLIIEPVLVGRGLPVVSPRVLEVRTTLLDVEKVHSGEVLLKYKVNRS